jgi:predicted RNase H-like HicB family nuclease
MSEYLVVIEHEGESWGAYCPDLPGVGVVGDSQEEVEKLIREAITSTSTASDSQASRSQSRPPSVRRWSKYPPPERNRCTDAQCPKSGRTSDPPACRLGSAVHDGLREFA